MVPAGDVFPRLPRSMIDEAVREVAPGYDLAREIKSASLALQPGAARTRAERTQAVVDDLAETVFPITLGADEIFEYYGRRAEELEARRKPPPVKTRSDLAEAPISPD